MGGFAYVLSRLAQGSAPPVGRKLPFDVIVLTAVEYQPPPGAFGPDTNVRRIELDDSGPPPMREDIREALKMGRLVAKDYRQGKRVLVTCAMGLNRSGLIVGLAMVELGYCADEVISSVRKARGRFALSNKHFEKLIRLHSMHANRNACPDRTSVSA